MFGVKANEQDIPVGWPTLRKDDLRPSALHATVRNYLDPPISIEVGVARHAEGDVVVVRVPDAPVKPVFVSDRGVLVRVGESNVPARLAQLAAWFDAHSEAARVVEGALYEAAPQLIGVTQPQINVAIGPSQPWPEIAWGDATDAAIEAAVRWRFSDVGPALVSTDFLQFRADAPNGDVERWVWFRPTGVVLRMCRLRRDESGRVSALQIAGQVSRAWQLALRAIPIVRPGYSGEFSLVVSVGGIDRAGLRSDYPLTTRLQEIPPQRDRIAHWTATRLGVAQDTDDYELLRHLMEAMLRNFGYTPSGQAAAELAAHAVWKEAEPPALPALGAEESI